MGRRDVTTRTHEHAPVTGSEWWRSLIAGRIGGVDRVQASLQCRQRWRCRPRLRLNRASGGDDLRQRHLANTQSGHLKFSSLRIRRYSGAYYRLHNTYAEFGAGNTASFVGLVLFAKTLKQDWKLLLPVRLNCCIVYVFLNDFDILNIITLSDLFITMIFTYYFLFFQVASATATRYGLS